MFIWLFFFTVGKLSDSLVRCDGILSGSSILSLIWETADLPRVNKKITICTIFSRSIFRRFCSLSSKSCLLSCLRSCAQYRLYVFLQSVLTLNALIWIYLDVHSMDIALFWIQIVYAPSPIIKTHHSSLISIWIISIAYIFNN